MALTKKKPDAPLNPVTPDARDAFMLYLRAWQEKLGLLDWRIDLSTKPAAKANSAEVVPDWNARLARVRIGSDFGTDPVNDETLEVYAVHELGHVMLKELRVMSRDQTVPEDVLDSAEHRVINAYTHALLGRN